MIRNLFLALILPVILLLSSCEFWQVPVRDYLETWTQEVYIAKFEVDGVESYTNKDGNLCIPSGSDAKLKLFLVNPRHYDYSSSEYSDKITSINTAIGNSNISLTADPDDTTVFHLEYKNGYLVDHDGKDGDVSEIGMTLALQHPLNGTAKEFKYNLKCNSRPPAITDGAVMTNNSTYYLCFNLPIPEIHSDLKKIIINDGNSTHTISCHVSGGAIVLDDTGNLSMSAPTGILSSVAGGADFTPGTNHLYYSSGIVPQDGVEQVFTITLEDEAGLTSSTVISTASKQILSPVVMDAVSNSTISAATSSTNPYQLLLNASSEYNAKLSISTPTQLSTGESVEGVSVKYTLKQNGSSDELEELTLSSDGLIVIQDTGTYELKVWAEKTGYLSSSTVTYNLRVRPLRVTFNPNGGTITTTTQDISKNTATNLTDSTTLNLRRKGYSFQGWAASSGGTKAHDDSDSVTLQSDITLYALWQANTYQVSFCSDGEIGMVINSVTYDSLYYYNDGWPTTDPEKEGYRFDGWFTSATGGTKITDQTSCTTASDHMFYAHWTARTYTVTLKYNYTNYGTYRTISVPYDAKYSDYLPSNPGRTGYSFTEWWTSSNDTGSKIETGTTCTTASNHTLYAHWTVRTYTVTLKYNYTYYGTYRTISVPYDAKYSDYLPQNPSRTGYSLAEWWTSADNTGTKIQTSTTCTTDSDHILYAHWNLNYHSVTCDSTNCSVSITSDVRQGDTYGYGSTVTVVITPTGDYGVYSITVPDGLNATDPVESGTNGKTKTITFTMPDENVTVTRVIKKAINVNITPYNCTYDGQSEFVKKYAKNKTVRLWFNATSTCYDNEGEYKEVSLDGNGEYHGYICYADDDPGIGIYGSNKLCVMSKTSFSDPSSDCRLFGFQSLTTSSTTVNISLAVILFQPGPKSTPENTTELEFYEHGSSLYASTNWETLGFKFYWVNNKKDESNHWIPYRTAGPTTSNSYTWSTSQFFSGENIISAYISVAGIKADSNSGYTINYP
ncbi:MAG: InlB B-repeat-containing protein [Treponema sp.]|nr:InlB B-repeat-containing protein [Treponema sp.]